MTMKYSKSTINQNSLVPSELPYIFVIVLFTFIARFPSETQSTFTPDFVWSAVNKTLDEDRLVIVDANNEKLKLKSCAKVVLYNDGSREYAIENHTKALIPKNTVLVDVTSLDFATEDKLTEVEKRIEAINPGICVPCIVVISVVNVTTMEGTFYKNKDIDQLKHDEKIIQNHKLNISLQFTQLLQFKTPIQARHLVIVRLVKTKEELTKCHGKKYTKYPRRLVSIWEQVLFDHFKEARVIQGATTGTGNSDTTLMSGKESGIWVWMCEEIVRRLDLQDSCKVEKPNPKCQEWEMNKNFSTARVDMTNREECGLYRPRT